MTGELIWFLLNRAGAFCVAVLGLAGPAQQGTLEGTVVGVLSCVIQAVVVVDLYERFCYVSPPKPEPDDTVDTDGEGH